MAAVGDLYQVVDVQTLASQQVLNVYFYRRTAAVITGSPAEAVADAFDGQMLPVIRPLQTGAITHTEIRVTNLYDPSDVHTKLISKAGTWAGGTDTENTFVAAGFKLETDNGALRSGAKRIGGIAEDVDNNSVFTNSTFIAALVAAGVGMAAGMDIGIIADALIPVVVKRILDGGDYRLPTNSGEGVYGNITDALYNIIGTSQVSRKIGSGV